MPLLAGMTPVPAAGCAGAWTGWREGEAGRRPQAGAGRQQEVGGWSRRGGQGERRGRVHTSTQPRGPRGQMCTAPSSSLH